MLRAPRSRKQNVRNWLYGTHITDRKGARCDLGAIEAGAPDNDADRVPDVIDDCPNVANTDQRDNDRDTFGDGPHQLRPKFLAHKCRTDLASIIFEQG